MKKLLIGAALISLCAANFAYAQPQVRPARPDEIPCQECEERACALRHLFPGAVGMPDACDFVLPAGREYRCENLVLRCPRRLRWEDGRTRN